MSTTFIDEDADAEEERELVSRAQAGDSAALESLIRAHQPWLFNIALRMVPDYHEAEDLCQEVLVASFRGLPSFRGDSRFKSWLYRIAVNKVLSSRESRCERALKPFVERPGNDGYTESFLDWDFADPKAISQDLALLAKEARIKCMLGMLVCLNRRQRMAYILGAILGVSGRAASELMGLSEASFRQTLSRARKRLLSFMSERCGLLNPEKACRCERCVASAVELGYIDPLRLVFGARSASSIRSLLAEARRRLDAIELDRCQELYREHPLIESPDYARKVRDILASEDARWLLDLEPST